MHNTPTQSIVGRTRPASFFLLIALCLTAGFATPAQAKFPLTVKSNTVYDGRGQTIDARYLSRVFNVWAVSNVTIKNYTIVGGNGTRVFDVSKSKSVTIENITIKNGAGDVVRIHASSGINVKRVVADTIYRYLVWVDNSYGIKIQDCKLTTGSRCESGIRVQEWTNNVLIERCSIRNVLNKQTAIRLHDGSNFTVRSSSFEGHVWFGPMGGNEGGQLVTNLTQRKLLLSKRTKTVLVEDVTVNGSLGAFAGLSGFTMNRGSVTAKNNTPFFSSPFNNVTWSYPDSRYLKSGDIKRPAPTGAMKYVKFIAGKTTLNYGGNGPFSLSYCTLNGRTVR